MTWVAATCAERALGETRALADGPARHEKRAFCVRPVDRCVKTGKREVDRVLAQLAVVSNSTRPAPPCVGYETDAPLFRWQARTSLACATAGTTMKSARIHMIAPTPRPKNALFAGLSHDALARVNSGLEYVPLRLGQVLYESGETMSHAYFPIDSIVSLLYRMENGESAEIAVVGQEGMVGIALFMGGASTMSQAVVQNAGHAYRMPAGTLVDEFRRGGDFNRNLLTFSLSLINQMTQSGACNRHHTLDQQLCRWILMSLDRLPEDRIEMTERLIGNMLGITAPAAGVAASALQTAGLVDYADGVIRVRDRAGVERRACECYAAVKRENDRLMPPAKASAEAFLRMPA